jgi:DNA-binding NarL/FixJ family response regulator
MVANARVLSVDDEEFIGETVRRLIAREHGIEFVGAMGSADHLAIRVAQTHATLVVLDLNMPGKDPLVALDEMHRIDPSVRVVIMSGDIDPALVRRAMRAGALGFISKDEPLEVIAAELRKAAEGENVMSPKVRECMGRHIEW